VTTRKEGTVVCSISSGFFAFCSCVVSSGVLLASSQAWLLAFPLFLFGAILDFGKC